MKFSRSIGLLALIISLLILWQVRQLLLLAFTAIVLATAFNKFELSFSHSDRLIFDFSDILLGLLMALPLTIVLKTWLEELWFKNVLDKWKNRSSTTSA